jgi:hypothetical protein
LVPRGTGLGRLGGAIQKYWTVRFAREEKPVQYVGKAMSIAITEAYLSSVSMNFEIRAVSD